MKSQKAPNFTKEKGKAPMASSSHSFHDKKNHDFIYTHVNNAKNAHHDDCSYRLVLPMRHDAFTPHTMIASSSGSYAHSRSRSRHCASHIASHVPKDRNASHGPSMFYCIFRHTMCFIVKMIELLLPMWNQNARRVRLVFGFQNRM
jgi:hypothetical protein